MNPLLHLRGIRKQHGERRVFELDELSFVAGNKYALTGDNGAGKTTLLRMIAGLDSGEIDSYTFDGIQHTFHPYPAALRQHIVYVHQHPYLFNTSVAHNIEYGLKQRNVAAADREAALDQAMRWAGLAHLADVLPMKLSGGEKQRVALARARVLNPQLILLDEPTSSLDAAGRTQVITLIEELCAENICVVIACHDRELIELSGTTVIRLGGG